MTWPRIRTTLIPNKFDALAIFPFILVRPTHAQDQALIAHEEAHLWHQLRHGILPWFLLYLCSWRYRLRAEIIGHCKQIRMGGITIEEAARRIITNYNIPIEEGEVIKRIEHELYEAWK